MRWRAMFSFIAIIVAQLNEGACDSWEEWWTYSGISGPSYWGLMNPQWNMCSRGRRQSPINIEPSKLLFDPSLQLLNVDKETISGHIYNTGQSLVFKVDKGTKHYVNISGGPLAYQYQFDEIYIHYSTGNRYGSEHRIHGYSFPGEIQLIGFNVDLYHNITEAKYKTQGVVAISLMIQISDVPNDEFRQFTSKFNKIRYKGTFASIDNLSITSLLPDTEQYMTYEGSITYPGCWETVTWIILNKPIYVTKQELYLLRHLMQGSKDTPKAPLSNNIRPVQPLYFRTVRTNIPLDKTKVNKCFSINYDVYYKANEWDLGDTQATNSVNSI